MATEYVLNCKLFLRLFGLYFFENDSKRRRLLTNAWMFFCSGLFLLTAIQALVQLLSREGFDLTNDCFGILTFFVKMGAFYHILYYFCRRETLHGLFDYMSLLFRYSSSTGLEEKDMKLYVKKMTHVLIFWTTSLTFAFAVALWPLAVKGRRLALDLWYPFDWRSSPNFELLFTMQTATESVMLMTYAICDGIFPCVCVIVVGQFQILSHNIVNIVNTALLRSNVSKMVVEKFSLEFNWPSLEKDGFKRKKMSRQESFVVDEVMNKEEFDDLLCRLLKAHIEHHQVLLEFCERMEGFFSPYMLVKVYLNRLYFCLEILCVLLSADTNLAFGIAIFLYAFAALWQLFLQTYFGQRVQDEGLNLGSRLYELPWYCCPRRFKALYRFVHMRCQRKIVFTTGKMAKLDTETFVIFLNVVLSYVAVLRNTMQR